MREKEMLTVILEFKQQLQHLWLGNYVLLLLEMSIS